MKNLYFFIILTTFKLYSSDCIPNQNCLKPRGECIDNICECYEEYWTLKPTKDNNLPNFYCNYEKRSRFLPLVLEFFIPGLGHLIMKKFLLGIIKIGLWLLIIISFFAGFRSHKLENIEQFEQSGRITPTFIQLDEKSKLINNKESFKNINTTSNENNKKYNNSERVNTSGMSEDIDSVDLETDKPYVANHEIKDIPLNKRVLNFIGFLSLICFFILYIFDLIAYGFAIYKDSNNVPFL